MSGQSASDNPCKLGNHHQIFFPHPQLPNKYIQCSSWGQKFIFTCPKNLIWNQEKLTCVKPVELPQDSLERQSKKLPLTQTSPVVDASTTAINNSDQSGVAVETTNPILTPISAPSVSEQEKPDVVPLAATMQFGLNDMRNS